MEAAEALLKCEMLCACFARAFCFCAFLFVFALAGARSAAVQCCVQRAAFTSSDFTCLYIYAHLRLRLRRPCVLCGPRPRQRRRQRRATAGAKRRTRIRGRALGAIECGERGVNGMLAPQAQASTKHQCSVLICCSAAAPARATTACTRGRDPPTDATPVLRATTRSGKRGVYPDRHRRLSRTLVRVSATRAL
jgi:hypothetical protein